MRKNHANENKNFLKHENIEIYFTLEQKKKPFKGSIKNRTVSHLKLLEVWESIEEINV